MLNLYLAYELKNWLHNPSNNFTLKNCLFGTDELIKNAIKSKFIYNGQGIAFDGACPWSFGNEFSRNTVISGVNNTSLSHTDNWKNNFSY